MPKSHLVLLALLTAIFVWSGIAPRDRFTWVLEVLPGVVGAVIIIATYQNFRFTTLVYTLIAIHATILFVGGHYTYAEVPAFNWIRDHFHMARNDFDRVGHFAQGFVPAMIARELLLRCSPVQRGKWLFAIVLAFCMGISAIYELFEWSMAVLTGTAADAFLGTQGDPFDTQKDMFMCLIGALMALILLPRWQDRQMRKLSPGPEEASHLQV